MLTQGLLHQYFDYDDGNLIWRIARQCIKAGTIAGSLKKDGYVTIKIDGKSYSAHRVVFLYHHGYLPQYVDHIDRNKANNKIENLRPITKSQNQYNHIKRKNATSQYRGVSWAPHVSKWHAQLKVNGKATNQGYFIDEIEAARAYDSAVIANDLTEYVPLNFAV